MVFDDSSAVVTDDVPEYRVRRHPDGPWVPATDQEAAEFRAHDQAVQEEAAQQAQRDEDNYQQLEAAISQQWDDWAMRSELDRESPLPSRKRMRVVMNVGDEAGVQLGEAHVEGTMDAGGKPVISFQVVETLLGTAENPNAELGPAAMALHANPQLADFKPESMPGMSESMKAFMQTREARYWLRQFAEGMASDEMICSRFGTEVLEMFQMWVAIKDDMDVQVRNCADAVRHIADTVCEDGGEDSDASTVAAGREAVENEGEKKGYIAPVVEAAGSRADSQEEEHLQHEGRDEGNVELEGTNVVEDERVAVASVTGEEEVQENEGAEHEAAPAVSHGEVEDTMDPLTGIPSKWAEFWRATNNNASIGVGLPDPVPPVHHAADSTLSDGFGTLPGNGAETADAESVAVAAAAASPSENRAASSTDGKRQLDLKGWLK